MPVMRTMLLSTALALVVVPAGAGDPGTGGPSAADPKRDYADFSRLIHKMVVRDLPKEFEDKSGWGQMVPLTEKLLFPNLPRARVRIGDKEGYPNGLWKKFKVRIDDPAKDLKINVREFSKVDPKTFRLVVDSEVALAGEGEVQNWQKGVPLGRISAQADALLGLGMVFEVGVTLNIKKFPPDLIIEPKLADLQIDLKEFILRRVANPTINLALDGDTARNLGEQMKDTLKSLVKNSEADIKNRANLAIAQSLKEGKGNVSAAALLKIAPPAKVKDLPAP
jgi:hypothetical protein